MAAKKTMSLSGDIAQKRQYLAQLQDLERRIERQELPRIAGRIRTEVQPKASSMVDAVFAATRGSHVGGDKCLDALNLALKRLANICNVLEGGGSGPSGACLGSSGSSTQSMIHGTDAIEAKSRSLGADVERVRLMGENLWDVQDSLSSVKTDDKDVFVDRLQGARGRVNRLATAMAAYSDVLASISKSYRDAQVRAIALADSIPRLI